MKTCAFYQCPNLCSRRRVKRDHAGHLARTGKNKTKTENRNRCTFKDKTECVWYKEMEAVTMQKWFTESKEVICPICNKTFFKLEIHHIDGNHDNNDPMNLLEVCLKCHCNIHNLKYPDKPCRERFLIKEYYAKCLHSKRREKLRKLTILE